MAATEVTITYDLADLIGTPLDGRRTKMWLTTNIENDTIVDTDGDQIRLGSGSATVAADGTGSVSVWVPGATTNPASWQTTFHVDYPDRNAPKGRTTVEFGPYTIAAAGDLADLIVEQTLPVDQVYDLVTRVDAIEASGGGTPTWDAVTDKPTSFPSTWTDVSGKPTEFTPSDMGIFSHLNNGSSFSRITVDAIAAGAANDAITTGLGSGGDIKAAIDTAVAGVSVDTAAFAFAPLKASLDQGNPRPVAFQVLGDSTGNDDTEWPRLTLAALASRYPSVTFQESRYSAGSEFAQVPTVIQTGTAGAAYLLVETGKTTPAIPQTSAPTFPAVLDLRVKLAADDWTSTTGGGVIMGRENGAPNRSWWFSLASSGYPQLTLSSDGTALTTIHNGGFPVPFADGATGWVRVVYTCDDGAGNRVFKSYTSTDGNTWTQLGTTTTTAGTLTPHNPTNAALTLGGRGGAAGLPGKIYEVQMLDGENGPDLAPRLPGSWPMTPTGTPMTVAGAPVCTLVNGSYSGANAAILSDSTRLAKMTPNYGQQVILVSDSHNEGGLVDADFIGTYTTLVDAVKARIPGVPITVLTQNPENGAVNQVAHSARRWNLVAFAAANGYALVDTYKAFLDYGAWETDLMADTLHPDADGSQLWADTVMATFGHA